MNSEILKRMVSSFQSGDGKAFVDAVRKLISSERRQGHRRVATDLERLLANGRPSTTVRPISPLGKLPRNKAEGAPLVDVRRTCRSLHDIVLAPDCRARVMRFLEEFAHERQLSERGLPPIRKLLFFGPPGNGKTLCAEVIARELDLPLFYVRFDGLVASYLGETAANLRRVFEYATQDLGVLFFDEVDAIGKGRGDRADVGELKRVVSSFLQLLDIYSGRSPVIAATNYERSLDYALWRRFDDVLEFPKATAEQIREYLQLRLGNFEIDVSLDAAVAWCKGMSYADVDRVVTHALKTMVLRQARAVTGAMLSEAAESHRVAAGHRTVEPEAAGGSL